VTIADDSGKIDGQRLDRTRDEIAAVRDKADRDMSLAALAGDIVLLSRQSAIPISVP
jgi:hypothetical protein